MKTIVTNRREEHRTIFEPYGFVELTKWMGDELDIVNAAKVSFAKQAESFGYDEQKILEFLLKNKHGSPFEQGFLSMWHIRMPIFVMREWVRHRVGFSLNEESGRYTEMRSDFFFPDHLRVQQGRPGAYTFERIDNPEMYEEYLDDLCEVNQAAWDFYQKWLKRGVAKEQARIALPLNLYTEVRWTANSRSLMNFLALRNAPSAMYEIRRYAEAIEDIFAYHMPTTHAAFVAAGRVAP